MEATPYSTRELRVLKALKRRLDRLKAADKKIRDGIPRETMAAKLDLDAAELNRQLREYRSFAKLCDVAFRVRWRDVPKTLRRGDIGKWKVWQKRVDAYRRRHGETYDGNATDANVRDPRLSALVIEVLLWQGQLWEKL